MKGLEDRRALVTGAAGDIGRAVALGLASHGTSLILADHPVASDRLGEIGQECEQALGSTRVETVEFDVADELAASHAIAQLTPAPSLVFNNAGVQGAFLPIHRYPAADSRRIIDVNVLGAMYVLAAAARAMIDRQVAGSIVNSASMAGVSGAPNMPAYSASKAAVIGLTLAVAKDLAPYRIRVNAVSPAFIGPGKMWSRQVEAQAKAGSQYYTGSAENVAQQMISQVPLRRYGSMEEVASCVLFLLSEESSYLTGVNLEIAGGAR